MRDSIARLVVVVAGLLFMAVVFMGTSGIRSVTERALTGYNDFLPMYVAAQFVGTPDLYNPTAYHTFMATNFNLVAEAYLFIRMPFYAALLWPLGILSYQNAYLAWVLLRTSAIAGFFVLWRLPSRADVITFAALNVPLFAAWAGGQDVVIFLILIAAATHWENTSRPFAAGLILSLSAIKPHLIILLPLLLIAQRRGRMAAGFITGGIAVMVLNFAVAGLSWPIQYFAVLTDERIHPGRFRMPNLHGLVFGLPYYEIWLALGSIAVVAATWMAVRRVDFRRGLGIVVLGSMLISYHSFMPDCVILFPLFLDAICRAKWGWLRFLSLVVMAPPLILMAGSPRPYPYALQVGLVLFFCALIYESFHIGRGSPPSQRRAEMHAGA